jgi:archaemetzincin
MLRVAILPIGRVDGEVLERLRAGLSEVFPDTEASILDDMFPPLDEAYNPKRRQYHSSRILSSMADRPSPHGDRILGVTEADLYVPGLNFVFGEAVRGGPAIISLFRLRPGFYGGPRDLGLFLERAVKEAVHELGHTLGLGHCPDPRCVMFFSNSIIDTDMKGRAFCGDCNRRVLGALRRLGRRWFEGD